MVAEGASSGSAAPETPTGVDGLDVGVLVGFVRLVTNSPVASVPVSFSYDRS